MGEEHLAAGTGRMLALRFGSASEFLREYNRNISKGGAFVPTSLGFELREHVRVGIELAWRSECLELDAEVVHVVPAELASAGATPGVAVQFLLPASELRRRLGSLTGAGAESAAGLEDFGERFVSDVDRGPGARRHVPAPGSEARSLSAEDVDPSTRVLEGGEAAAVARAPRQAVRVRLGLRTPRGEREVLTRDVSRTGVLVSTDGSDLPVGTRVGLVFTDPLSGETLEVAGEVARQVHGQGTVTALGIRFDLSQGREAEVAHFLQRLTASDHARRLGGIRGSVPPSGIAELLQGLGKSAPCGTLTLHSRGEEGVVAFENGRLRAACLGGISGTKALARILDWRDGWFEFHTHVDVAPEAGAGQPLEGAILEAVIALDETRQGDPAPLEAAARLALVAEASAQAAGELDAVELAVLDLARAGFSVRRVLDVIPEPDARVREAIQRLRAAGLVTLHG